MHLIIKLFDHLLASPWRKRETQQERERQRACETVKERERREGYTESEKRERARERNAPRLDIPQLSGMIKRARDELVPSLVEAERHDFCRVSQQCAQLGTRLHVPQFGRVIHRPAGGGRGGEKGGWERREEGREKGREEYKLTLSPELVVSMQLPSQHASMFLQSMALPPDYAQAQAHTNRTLWR